MTKARILSILIPALLLSLVLFASCTKKQPSGTETDPSTDTPTTPTVTEPDSEPDRETDTSADTQPDTEATDETSPVTQPETEPETDYDITKPEVMPQMNENYYNVRTYGAVGDGVADDTEAVRAVMLAAYKANGVAYFPEGTYLVTETVTLDKNDARTLRVVGDHATLVGDASLEGPILKIDMKYNFTMYNLDFIHHGQGSCVDALYLVAQYCRFTSDAGNPADIVVFHGSNCRVIECSFDGAAADVYALSYIKTRDEISINDHIVDNVFRGECKGIRVGDGDYKEDGRCEGLKINGNYFYNTGSEQIRVEEILHINIAHNVMKGCTGTAIVLTQAGHGADGIYINDNRIEAAPEALACIAGVPGGDDYISSVNINNNIIRGAQYGVYDEVIMTRVFIRANTFVGQSVSGYWNREKRYIKEAYLFFDNLFDEPEGVCSLTLQSRGTMVFERNSIGETNSYTSFFNDIFPTDQIHAVLSGDNPSRLDPPAPSGTNEYKGEEDIGHEQGDEPETEAPMDVAILSPDPIEADMFTTEKVLHAEAYDIAGDLMMHFAATAHFDRITIICPSWGDSIGSIHVTLYQWDQNYEKTLAGTPIATEDWINFPDNNRNQITFDTLPAGNYALVLTVNPDRQSEHVGVWVQTVEKSYMKVYKNGVLCEGLEVFRSSIHYTETPEVTLWEASKER